MDSVPLWTVPHRMAVIGAGAALAALPAALYALATLEVFCVEDALGISIDVVPVYSALAAIGISAVVAGVGGGDARSGVIPVIGVPPADGTPLRGDNVPTPLASPNGRSPASTSPDKHGWGRRRGTLMSRAPDDADPPDGTTPVKGDSEPPAATSPATATATASPHPSPPVNTDADPPAASGRLKRPTPVKAPPSPPASPERPRVELVVQSPSPEPGASSHGGSGSDSGLNSPQTSNSVFMKHGLMPSPGGPSPAGSPSGPAGLRRQGREDSRGDGISAFLRSPGAMDSNLRRIPSKHERKMSQGNTSLRSMELMHDGSAVLAVPGPASPKEAEELHAQLRANSSVRRISSRKGSVQPLASPLRLEATNGTSPRSLRPSSSSPQMRRISSRCGDISPDARRSLLGSPRSPVDRGEVDIRAVARPVKLASFGSPSPTHADIDMRAAARPKKLPSFGSSSPVHAGGPGLQMRAVQSPASNLASPLGASPRSVASLRQVPDAVFAQRGTSRDQELQKMLRMVEESADQNERLAKEVIRTLEKVQAHERAGDDRGSRKKRRSTSRRPHSPTAGTNLTINVNTAATAPSNAGSPSGSPTQMAHANFAAPPAQAPQAQAYAVRQDYYPQMVTPAAHVYHPAVPAMCAHAPAAWPQPMPVHSPQYAHGSMQPLPPPLHLSAQDTPMRAYPQE